MELSNSDPTIASSNTITEIMQNKLFRLNVNFVYEELLNQFLNNNGEVKLSTFWLISWGIVCNPKNDEIYGKLEKEIVYKCYISYMIQLFSKYIKGNEDVSILNEIQAVLYNGNLIFSTPFSFTVTNELKLVCLKAMAYSIKKDQENQFSDHFKNLLTNQDLIDLEICDDYTWEKTYEDVCIILKREKYIKDKSFLQSVSDLISDEFRNYNNGLESYTSHLDHLISNVIVNDYDHDQFNNNFENYQPSESDSSNSSFYFTRTDESKNFAERVVKKRKLSIANKNQVEDQNEVNSVIDDTKENDNDENEDDDNEANLDLNEKPRTKSPWTDQEELHLVFFTELMGRSWLEMSEVYRNYFQNRNRKDLLVKYTKLEKNTTRIKDLKKRCQKLKEKDFKKEERVSKKREINRWDEEELLYLVHGVEKMGRRWSDIFSKYQKYFKSIRKSKDLQGRYIQIEKNESSLAYFKKKAKSIRD